MTTRLFAAVMAIAMCGLANAATFAGTTECTPQQTAKLTADDGASQDQFGYSVATSGGIAVIGSHRDDDNGDYSGSAYVYELQGDGTWQQTAKLTADDGASDDHFGISVATSDGIAVIGAYADDDNGSDSGSVYVYELQGDGTWQQTAKLTADDGGSGDYFGISVATSGGIAVIGANGDDDNGDYSGSAYVYEQQVDGTWQQTAKLTADDGAYADFFGCSVAIADGIAVIGANGDDDNGSDSGSVYVYEKQGNGTWQQIAKLTANDGAESDQFGRSVATSGGVAVIGANGDDDNGSDSGSAYVYELQGDGTWQQTAKLTADDGASGDNFGYSVAASNGVAVIGAFLYYDDNGTYTGGSAYVYEQQGDGTWQQTAKLTADDGGSGDYFGISVATSGGIAVIGAYGDDDNGDYSGSAYVFEQQVDGGWNPNALMDCNENGICDFDEIAAAPFKDANENGILDECEVGACCISTTVVCEIAQEYDCIRFGGLWQGLETTCEDADCPTTCLGDVTGDGEVSVNDLLTVIANWGPCP